MLISDDDLIAIHRVNAIDGAGAAMVELRRRWLALTDATAPAVLTRVLAMRVSVPSPITATTPGGRSGPRHDGPVAGRASRKPKAP